MVWYSKYVMVWYSIVWYGMVCDYIPTHSQTDDTVNDCIQGELRNYLNVPEVQAAIHARVCIVLYCIV